MFDCTGIRPARFVSLEKGRAPTLSRHFKVLLPVPPRGRNTLPRGGRRAKLSDVVLADFCLIVSCLAARSAFPYVTEKAAALPVAKHHRLRPRTYIYWVATAIGVVRPLAGLGSMSIKNALSSYSGVFHRPWNDTVLLRLAMAKVRKNPEPPKKFGKKLCGDVVI